MVGGVRVRSGEEVGMGEGGKWGSGMGVEVVRVTGA